MWSSAAQPLFLTVALCATSLAVYTWAGDGGEGWNSAPALLRDPLWALWVAAAAMLLALALKPSALRADAARLWPLLETLAPALAGAAAAAMLWCIWHHGAFVAGGSDSSGYVSQASLWARGDILVPTDPLIRVAPWRDAQWTFLPLGYCFGPHPGTLAPSYAPGLPLLMAVAQRVAGPNAVYAIVPLTGLLLLASVYALGRRLAGPVAGAMATALVASSPIVLMMVMQPMSDLPAAAFWVAATAAALRTRATSPLLAGLLASLAILVRPNLVPLVLPLALFIAYRSPGYRATVRAVSLLALGVLPGVALTAAIHTTLYGSPLRSGYGPLADIFGWQRLLTTATAYPARALASHTALLGIALAAPLMLRSPKPADRALSASVFLLAMTATTFLCYAFYPPFEPWWSLRFLTGSIVWLLVLASAVLVRLIERLPSSARAPAALLAASLAVGLLLQRGATRHVFTFGHGEQRYLATARWINQHLPRRAVLMCMQHSGSLRYYTGRPILRWDLLPARKLDRALRFLRERGYSPYFVLECPWETRAFAIHFYSHSDVSQLDWPARAAITRGACVRIFDPGDRARYRSGERLVTERLR
jgi:hypothetical protein